MIKFLCVCVVYMNPIKSILKKHGVPLYIFGPFAVKNVYQFVLIMF